MILLVAGCGGPGDDGAPADLGTFKVGEVVAFRIEDTVYVCSDRMPYAIVQVTGGEERPVALRHSCLGEVGMGSDQFCENGQVQEIVVRTCSDVIFCEDEALDLEVAWDQQAYVQISEKCGEQTIVREVKEQVAAGEYQVVVQDWKEDGVEDRVIARFCIGSE